MTMLADFNGKECPYCGRAIMLGHPDLTPTRDHVLPKSKGGTAILIVCYRCNHEKGDMMPDRYLKRLRGCRRTLVRLAMIGVLRNALDNPENVDDLPAPANRTSPFSTTSMHDAFARAGARM